MDGGSDPVFRPEDDLLLHGGGEAGEIVAVASDADDQIFVFFGTDPRPLEGFPVGYVDLHFESAAGEVGFDDGLHDGQGVRGEEGFRELHVDRHPSDEGPVLPRGGGQHRRRGTAGLPTLSRTGSVAERESGMPSVWSRAGRAPEMIVHDPAEEGGDEAAGPFSVSVREGNPVLFAL